MMGDDEDNDGASGVPGPHTNTALFGHEAAEVTLLDAYRSGRFHHAWLIGGPAGIGKATLAWRLARFILANPDFAHPDVQTATALSVAIDHPAAQRVAAGSHSDVVALRRQWNDKTKKLFGDIRVDDVRSAIGLFQRASAAGGYRICIIDTADDLNRSSANALLKIIEEPPPRSVFLVLANRLGQVMPTIVSRCRRLTLPPLEDPTVERAIRALGGAWAAMPNDTLAAAIKRAQGSVGRVIDQLSGGALERDGKVLALLRSVPDVDWRGVHALADRVGMSGDTAEAVLDVTFQWLANRLRDRAGATSVAELKQHADAWAAIRSLAREAEVLNLDKRALLLSVFGELAKLSRSA